MTTSISLVIPAYNEARRLPPYLTTIREYLAQQFGNDYECSWSTTAVRMVCQACSADAGGLAAAEVPPPHSEPGQRCRVRTGMLAAEGRLLLFADADGATPIAKSAACGPRLTRAPTWPWVRGSCAPPTWSVAGALPRLDRSALRPHGAVRVAIAGPGHAMRLQDVSPRGGRRLFEQVAERGYLFDLELLILARRLGYRIAEVPSTGRPARQPAPHGWRILANSPGAVAVAASSDYLGAIVNHPEMPLREENR